MNRLMKTDTCNSGKQDPTSNTMKLNDLITAPLALAVASLLAGCATESNKSLPPTRVASAGTVYHGPKSTLVVGGFDNRSSYLRGLFSDGADRLGGQGKSILITHLQQTGRFIVVDRDNMEEIAREASFSHDRVVAGVTS